MYVSIALKIFFGLIGLLIVIRLLGKKELSQITPFDFIYLILLGSFLEEGVFDEKVSIFHILYAVAIWGGLIYLIEVLVMKSDRFRKLLKGESSDLIIKGKVDIRALKKNHIEMEQLRILMRNQGYFSLTEIEHATLETSGTLSVLPKAKEMAVKPGMLNITPEENAPTYLLVDEGEVEEKELKKAGKSKEWLLSELKKEGVDDIADIFYGEWSEKIGFYLIPYEERK
ncbi:DUF421 domain-containing protein [Bacillus aerolatus]|uniref:DUF421 domain-containing protein n=1 Tax=Bacillus aerolatus TaxID=2653354 RepID=A0A6I1FK09_9BACI|nr:DUF421 domain-containing protein [Bacillus aerolatus]KAB7709005.1 DUF421 domain-containing protein [Bacillus aerolatus]